MNNFDAIEDYVNGTMTVQERIAFETRLKEDSALQKDYDDWVNTENILRKHLAVQQNVEQLKTTLTPLTNQYFGKGKTKTKIISLKSILISATAVAAALIIYFSLPGGIENYTDPEMPMATVRGSEDLSNKAAQLFNSGAYKEALPLLQQEAKAKPNDATTNYFYAVCLVKTKKYDEALLILQPILNGTSAFKGDAAFFAAYSCYHTNKKEDALKYASMVPKDNLYYKNALEIKQKLD